MRAARRQQAEQGLIDLQTTLAAVAACMTKEGSRLVEKVEKALRTQLNG